MACSDAFRSYDTVRLLSVAETIERQALHSLLTYHLPTPTK